MPKTLPMIDMSAPVCCAPVAAGPISDDDALHIALRLKALADPARVKIMSYLFSSSSGEENSGELAAALGLTESTVSHHLTQLRRAGLVESERRGMNVYHRPHRDAVGALCAVWTPTAAPNAALKLRDRESRNSYLVYFTTGFAFRVARRHVIASAIAMCPSKPSSVAIAR